MKIVILAGGLGSRLSEYTKSIPKPMVKVGKFPIIIHIMSHYISYGYNDFNFLFAHLLNVFGLSYGSPFF